VDRVSIRIFTESGRRIKTIDISAPDQRTEMGCHQVDWNLRDGDGDWISNGVYIYQVRADGRSLEGKDIKAHEDRKLVILR
jgi:flagellar hook assembly protein FlgD